jgi:hypothetical protein
MDGSPATRVVIWPVFIPAALDSRSASAAAGRLAARLEPGAAWRQAEAGPTAVRLVARTPEATRLGLFTWISAGPGSASYFYLLSSPASSFANLGPTFARILSSFRLTDGTRTASPEQATEFVSWQDPRESAFTLQVPKRWRTSGGLFRFASVDVRGAWETVSPDGKTRISGGDAENPTFTQPNPMLEMTGFREGSWYSPGYGVNMLVRRYLTGSQFAREYVERKVASGCTDLVLTGVRDRPDVVAAINRINQQFAAYGMSIQLTAGEVTFKCRRAGEEMSGYYFAGTQLTQSQGMAGGIWNVEHLFGFLTPARQESETRGIMNRIIASIQLNPQWVGMQQNLTANTSRIVSQTAQAISEIVSHGYEQRSATMDEISRRRSNAILSVEDVVDPTTGREFKVESGSNYYWIDHRGTIVGTQTDSRPNLDFRELTRLP